MIVCKSCKKSINEGKKFCIYCGAAIEKNEGEHKHAGLETAHMILVSIYSIILICCDWVKFDSPEYFLNLLGIEDTSFSWFNISNLIDSFVSFAEYGGAEVNPLIKLLPSIIVLALLAMIVLYLAAIVGTCIGKKWSSTAYDKAEWMLIIIWIVTRVSVWIANVAIEENLGIEKTFSFTGAYNSVWLVILIELIFVIFIGRKKIMSFIQNSQEDE